MKKDTWRYDHLFFSLHRQFNVLQDTLDSLPQRVLACLPALTPNQLWQFAE